MREIKFRVFDKVKKEMYYLLGDRWSFGPCEGVRAVSWEDVFATQEPDLIPLQYVGLKDKDGKYIYEGDILKDESGIGRVTWVQEHCAFLVFVANDSSGYYLLESDGQLTVSEVIGNVYENPELLV